MTDPSELADRVATGELPPHELEEHADPDVAETARRRFIEGATGTKLTAIGDHPFTAGVATANIENPIGATQIPLGVAGPVTVNGGAADGERYLPLATTEGALVASVNRGCSVIEDGGGATARIVESKMTRAPVFRTTGVDTSVAVAEWAREHTDALAEAAEATTNHGELLAVTPYVVGDNLFLRFAYDTKDAMGMNMATIATEAACEIVERETAAELVALSGNLCTDKKPAAINAIAGRGRTVTADVVVPHAVVEDRLHTTSEAIAEVNVRKNHVGSAKAASLGHNAQTANVVAAMFLATGQDAAQVVEGANAITTAEARDEGLYLSVTLASVEVGTVGGGTSLPTQAEALDLLGVHGGGDPAGTNAGALAGECSLLAAMASRHLASAHESLGR